jgi:hypothetical protein
MSTAMSSQDKHMRFKYLVGVSKTYHHDWMNFVRDTDQWQALMNTVMSLRAQTF